jgi:hypothetical protein
LNLVYSIGQENKAIIKKNLEIGKRVLDLPWKFFYFLPRTINRVKDSSGRIESKTPESLNPRILFPYYQEYVMGNPKSEPGPKKKGMRP